MSHMRYPEDLFTIQRYQLTRYHVTERVRLLLGSGLLGQPEGPHERDTWTAAVLPDAADAGSEGAIVLAHVHFIPGVTRSETC